MKQVCIDKKFEKMLYAYELGLLNNIDSDNLEIHLLDCESCFEKVSSFEKAAHLLRNNSDVKQSVVNEQKKRNKYKIMTTIVSVAAVIILLLLNPWSSNNNRGVYATGNSISVLYFENMQDINDTDKIGKIVSNLLITDLAESKYIDVISSQHIYDLLSYLDKQEIKVIDKNTATEIAKMANSKWMITGSILQTEPTIIISSQVSEVYNGKVIASQKITGTDKDDIFTMIDKLSQAIKDDFNLPAEEPEDTPKSISAYTTDSYEAYYYYLEGHEYENKMYLQEAVKSYEKAIELDTTFTMAYYRLSRIGMKNYLIKAIKNISKSSKKNKYLIRCEEAILLRDPDYAIELLQEANQVYPKDKDILRLLALYAFQQSRYAESIEYNKKIIEIDEMDKTAYNLLAYSYMNKDMFEKALESIDRYISLAPDEANPYDSKAHIYALHGDFEEAITYYQQALKKKANFYSTIENLMELYVLTEKFSDASELSNRIIEYSDSTYVSYGYYSQALIQLYQGKISKGLKSLQDGIAYDIEKKLPNLLLQKYRLRSKIYFETGKYTLAMNDLDICEAIGKQINPLNVLGFRHIYSTYLLESGETNQALSIASSFQNIFPTPYSEMDYGTYGYNFVLGHYELKLNNFQKALEHFKTADNISSSYYSQYMIAVLNYELGNYGDAITKLEDLVYKYKSLHFPWVIQNIKAYYYLGASYEKNGQFNKAIASYESLLNFWDKSEYDFKEIKLTRANLKRLKTKI